jgi:hypothetical protein
VALTGIQLMGGEAIGSGEWLRVVLSGHVKDPDDRHHDVGLRVRALQSGQTVFAVNLERLGVALPADRPFEVEIDLQANLSAGLYAVESMVWNRRERREAAAGPHVIFQVGGEPGFFGSVNMHPAARLSQGTGAAQ